MRIIRGYFLRRKRNSKCYLEKLCMKNMYEVMASDVFITFEYPFIYNKDIVEQMLKY